MCLYPFLLEVERVFDKQITARLLRPDMLQNKADLTSHMTVMRNDVKYVIDMIQNCQEIARMISDPLFGRVHLRKVL